VGSAQRRRPHAVLQHGSVLLGASSRTPELIGVSELAAETIRASSIVSSLRDAIPASLGLAVQEGNISEEEASLAIEKTRSLFGDPLWTSRR
jgi:lipoate-protein ligase A